MPDLPPSPLHDPRRLAALRGTGLLDSLPDEPFDRLTRLAARLLAAPTALVSLVDRERQFLKSAVGVPEPWASRREMPIEYSFCRYALGAAEPLVIEDARLHPLTRDSPAVAENGARAYAGVPLTSEGQVVGTLCVVDTRARGWTADEIQSLRDLAAAAQAEVELRRGERRAREGQAQLAAIVDAQQAVSRAGLDSAAVLAEIVERACALTDAEAAFVALPDGDALVPRAACGNVAAAPGTAAALAEPAVRTGHPILSADAETDDRVDRAACRVVGARSLLVVPLDDGDGAPGALVAHSPRPAAFADADVHALRLLASLLASALRDAGRLAREQELVARLRGSEALYRSVVEGAAEGFFLVAPDPDGAFRYQMMNRVLVRMAGVRPDFVGRTPAELFPAATAARVEALYRQVAERGTPIEVEHTNELPGGVVTTRTRLHPLPADDGAGVRVLGITEDVTERVRVRRLAEEAAADARSNLAILEGVLRALPVGVLITDARGAVQVANPAAVRIWGGRTPLVGVESYGEYAAWRADTGAPVAAEDWPIARAIRTGEAVVDEEVEIRAFDGTRRTILASGLRIHDEAGRILGGVAVNTDITARKEMEEALRESRGRFRTAFTDAPIGMALVALDGRWLEVNAALTSIVGYTEAEMFSRTFQEITHPDDLDADLAHVQQLLDGSITSYQMEKRYLHRAGHTVWVQLTGSLVRGADGAPRYFIAQVQDVTERVRVQERLAGYARELERSNRELQDFAYVASHDLQEPLRKIQAFGDRLQARYPEALGEQGADYLARMQSAARRMQTLIQDLLAYSRVGSQAQPFVAVELDRVAREVVADLQTTVEASGGTVELLPLPTVRADPLQMRQLLQNLVGNALKFHRPGVAPRVRVSGEPAGEEGVRIRVDDEGIGFEPQYAERIFTVFERLHGRADYGGTGIGLAICRKIVRRHGGEITAEGRPGEGASFVVTLPAGPAQSEGAEA